MKGCPRDALVDAGQSLVTIDAMIEVVVDGKHYKTLYGIPSDPDLLVNGLLVAEGSGNLEAKVVAVETLELEDLPYVRVYAKTTGRRDVRVERLPVDCSAIERLVKLSYALAPKRECPAALHFGVVYVYDDGLRDFRPLGVVYDVSRHTLALKLAGLLRVKGDSRLLEPIVFVSSRPSGDMVHVLGKAGFRVIVAFHHPIYSALRQAARYNVTLVLRDSSNRLYVAVDNGDVRECSKGPDLGAINLLVEGRLPGRRGREAWRLDSPA